MRRQLAYGAALGVLAAAAMTSAVYAQETTGGMRGQVTNAAGESVAGATVVIQHLPTGATVTTVTNDKGFFSARGLRVGGPYSVKATTAAGDVSDMIIPSIALGDPTQVDVAFEDTGAVSEVTVTAAAGAPPTQGVGNNFTAADIASLPSISRDLKDVARLDPFATIDPTNQDALSFAGANTRFNQITVDGIRQNDDFGLNNNGYPTQRSPISTEAVGGLQVSIAPFSVVNNGFTGGSINAVTKSGGNEFHGSLFGDKTTDKLRGDKYTFYDKRSNSPTLGDRVSQNAATDFSEKTWGATLGGPILKDRVFFFLSYEKYEAEFGFDEGPADSGRATVIPRITQAAIDTFQAGTKSKYGIDPGNWVRSTPPITDEKILAKIDWDINADHRLSLTFQDTEGQSFNGSVSEVFVSGDSTSTGTAIGNGSPRIGLESAQYVKNEHMRNYTAQLNSRWSDNLTSELRFGHKEVETVRNSFSPAGVGQVTVAVNDLAGVQAGEGNASIRFGTEANSQPNYLSTKNDTFEGRLRYTLAEHDLMVGARMEHVDVNNIFGSGYFPRYAFNSYADFLAGRASQVFIVGAVEPDGGTVPATGGTAARNAAKGDYYLNTVYAEDSVQVTDNLTLLTGVRYDWYVQDGVPDLNVNFVSRHGFDNTATLDGKGIILPRAYLKWTPSRSLDFAVGTGRFSTAGLGVWLFNPFSNSGVVQVNGVCPAGPYTVTDLTKVPAGCTFTPGNGDTNSIDPTFKIPSVWKTTLSAGYNFDLGRFGDRWRIQADYIHQDNENSPYWYDLRAIKIGNAPDGRPVYGRTTTGTIGANVFDLQYKNAKNGGNSDSVAISLGNDWRGGLLDGLALKASYTYTDAKDRNPMTSSIASSSYTRFATYDAQNPALATSDYEIRHKATINVSYERAFFGDNKTLINIFAQQRSGLPFSYTFDASSSNAVDAEFGNYVTSYSGRQAKSNALLYVPKTDSSGNVTATSDAAVKYAAGFDVENFNAFLKNTGLIKYQGQIAPRNGFRGPKVTTVDLHFSQEIPAFVPKGAKLLAFFDIENFGNLLNSKWGVLEQYDFYRGVPVINITCGGAGGSCANQASYTYSGLQTAAGTNPAAGVKNRDQPIRPYGVTNSSLWQMKIGLKYQF